MNPTPKHATDYSHFEALDIRVGRVAKVEDALTKKPTYRLTIDFGPEIGIKTSCGAYKHYPKESLVGSLVVAVVNFPPRKMGPETSQVLVLGAPSADGNAMFLSPTSDVEVPLGGAIY
jgi:tRNA-binding protein